MQYAWRRISVTSKCGHLCSVAVRFTDAALDFRLRAENENVENFRLFFYLLTFHRLATLKGACFVAICNSDA